MIFYLLCLFIKCYLIISAIVLMRHMSLYYKDIFTYIYTILLLFLVKFLKSVIDCMRQARQGAPHWG